MGVVHLFVTIDDDCEELYAASLESFDVETATAVILKNLSLLDDFCHTRWSSSDKRKSLFFPCTAGWRQHET